MKVFGANITNEVRGYLNDKLADAITFEQINQTIFEDFGLIAFVESNIELEEIKKTLLSDNQVYSESDRAEYGDFQTNETLANKAVLLLIRKNISPQIVVEPTCGKGNFIVASLRGFKALSHLYGVEIYKPYIWETKFNIIDFYLNCPNKEKTRPSISIIHGDVFDFDFKNIAAKYTESDILVIGNPPWVTNSKLGSLHSDNLPRKTNFKNHNGLDAMTGKGNFDIGESVTLAMLNAFQNNKGNLFLLVKNTVIKNIVFDQKTAKYAISILEKHTIDSKKEFNVAVEASLFYCQLNTHRAFDCQEFDFYSQSEKLQFGWSENKFVANIGTYSNTQHIDGYCPFVWRQGLKHDCSTIMELDKTGGESLYVNGLNEEVILEDGLVYGILKSSDLKNTVINQTRKYTIVTQKKVGQETMFIKNDYPHTYQYLTNHQATFEARKSSIYTNKPSFSIFGIGDYSFKPFKVAISGLYKTFYFTLVLPQNQKPVMLDDTCYLLGFDKIEFAVYTLILLNSETTKQFLQSITFADAKRTFTKDVLMRIDLLELAKRIDKTELEKELQRLNKVYNFSLTTFLWDKFIKEMTPTENIQIELFG
jgi:hypothetical protein